METNNIAFHALRIPEELIGVQLILFIHLM